ncbi:MAG: glycosyltransferase family 2 protein [Hungatella sp.]|nr:glycosyltransferase family 2 protein [Hungatella sp.]
MNQPLISVIVPIYMIDRYIGICIESIIHQTYENLEIILVDDGGKDRCPEICDLYSKKDKRIRVIHKPNGGLVSARKAGLWQSNGEYISYIDGDDWIAPGFIEALFEVADTSDADMVCAGFTRDLFSKSEHFINAFPSGIYEGEHLRNLWKSMISYGLYYRPGISTYVWNKLFKRETLINQQSHVDPRISIGEDGAVTYPVLLQCRRVAVADNVAYHYRQREDSMLKQSVGYAQEAQKLLYLYGYMMKWAEKIEPELGLIDQVTDYVLSIAMIRSGGRLPQNDFSIFGNVYYGKDVVVYSAGTFGQQLINRFRETKHCNLVAWLDDDYWEYRRCCLNVDPVETISKLSYDYILIATMDGILANLIIKRLLDLGVSRKKILTVTISENKEQLIKWFLDVDALKLAEAKRKRGMNSHA